jgi:hypothetical protein
MSWPAPREFMLCLGGWDSGFAGKVRWNAARDAWPRSRWTRNARGVLPTLGTRLLLDTPAANVLRQQAASGP